MSFCHAPQANALPPAKFASSLLLACLLQLFQIQRVRAETHFDYKYEDYSEDQQRMRIKTHSALFELDLDPRLSLKGEYVYDGISGATPTGAYNSSAGWNPNGGNTPDVIPIKNDIRRAGSISPTLKLGRYSITPQLSYSKESDYESKGLALNQSLEFNEKNTTVNLGISRDFDEVTGSNLIGSYKDKESQDYLLGVTQVLDPRTTISAAFTLGFSRGYLADPYKLIGFDIIDVQDPTLTPFASGSPGLDVRPHSKLRQVFHTELAHFFPKANGSAELAYRFHHDSFDIFSHTIGGTWNQKLGKLFVLSPSIRYYSQSAASFYAPNTTITLDSNDPNLPAQLTDYYNNAIHSADHRLSRFDSVTYGVKLTATLHEHVWLDFAYKRYEMRGTDGVTPASVYPSANVFTAGLRLWY